MKHRSIALAMLTAVLKDKPPRANRRSAREIELWLTDARLASSACDQPRSRRSRRTSSLLWSETVD
jgi:hypothetical protein